MLIFFKFIIYTYLGKISALFLPLLATLMFPDALLLIVMTSKGTTSVIPSSSSTTANSKYPMSA